MLSSADNKDAERWDRLTLTSQQREIVEAFRRAGEIVKVFEAGARLRNQDGFPARMYLIAHAMREVINRLPDYYAGVVSIAVKPEKSKRLQPHQKQVLYKRWREAAGEQLLSTANVTPSPMSNVILALDVAIEIDNFLNHEASVSQTRRDRFAAFLGTYHNLDPALMRDIASGFMRIPGDKYAHLPLPTETRDEAAALAIWDQFESQMYALCGARHTIYSRIDTDLNELNAL